MPFAEVNGVSIFFTDDGGDRPPVVLVHGWGCDSNDWIWQIPALLERHRVIAIDLRGHGRSEVADAGYSIESFAEDVVGVVRMLVDQPCVVVGHSLGGIVVSLLAVQYPELVSGIVVIDPAYAIQDGERVIALTDAARAAGSGDDPLDDDEALLAIANFFPQLSTSMTPPHLKEWHRRRALGTPLSVLVATTLNDVDRRRWIGLGFEGLLKRRSAPVLAIHRRAVAANWEESLLAGVHDQVVHMPGGHWPHQERPDAVNKILSDWLDALSRSS